ncbi:SEC-C metal-binding domain-containing protein [Psychrobacillus sp. BM2]
MTGRNDPCPCSSGKKYKVCCLKKLYVSEKSSLIQILSLYGVINQ